MLYGVSNVVDRNLLICMRVEEMGCYCLEKMVWWKVDFG